MSDNDRETDNEGNQAEDEDFDFEEEFRDRAEEEFDEHLYEETDFETEGWDEIFSDPEMISNVADVFGGAFQKVLKKTVKAGVGTVSMSEERLKKLLSQGQLPKEAVGFILGQLNATKRELTKIISREIRMFLEDADFGGELTKILTSLAFEIKMEVRFVPNDEAVSPNIRGKVRSKRREENEEDSDE